MVYQKFFIVLIFNIVISIALIFGFGSNRGNYLRRGAKDWSEEKKKTANFIIKWAMRILSLSIIVFVVIPMVMDLPNLLAEKYLTESGRITVVNSIYGNRWLTESITIDRRDNFDLFFGPILSEGENITIEYLPHSKIVVQVFEKN